MSYLISGAFNLKKSESYTLNDIMIDDCIISFQEDESVIHSFLSKGQSDGKSIVFSITSKSQKFYSENILYPYDDYSHEELFPMGDDNVDRFLEICKAKLIALKKVITSFVEQFELAEFIITISDGDDEEYEVFDCNIEQLINELYQQVEKNGIYKTLSYRIKVTSEDCAPAARK